MFDVFHFQTYVAQQVQTSCNLKNKQSGNPGSRTTLFVFMKFNRVDWKLQNMFSIYTLMALP
jgi:hypothetical protein